MQGCIIEATQTTRYIVVSILLIQGKADFVQICTNTILKIRYHQVMTLQPTITNTSHETNCISRCFLHYFYNHLFPKLA